MKLHFKISGIRPGFSQISTLNGCASLLRDFDVIWLFLRFEMGVSPERVLDRSAPSCF